MVARVPEQEETDPARQGTCAAWLAELVLRGELKDCYAGIGMSHENGWLVDPTMAHHIQGYVDMLRKSGGKIDVERKVRLNEMIAGTPDAYAVFTHGLLSVDDLKYGYEVVEPLTEQVIIYAGAILRLLASKGIKINKIRLGIYQPRAVHASGIHRTVTLWPEELMRHVRRVEAAGVECQSPNAMATPGRHCKHCPAAATCDANGHELYKVSTRMHNAQQHNMSVGQLATELEFLETISAMIKGRKNAVEAEAMAHHKAGRRIPGRHLEHGMSPRKWKYSRAVVQGVTKIDPVDETKLITPAEMERRLRDKGFNPDTVMGGLTTQNRTSAKLVATPAGHYKGLFGQ
jgi:hypothetical protein